MKPWGLAAACPGGLQERASNVWLSFLQPSGGGGGARNVGVSRTGGPQHFCVLRNRCTNLPAHTPFLKFTELPVHTPVSPSTRISYGRAQECAFLSSQGMLMLLIEGPHFITADIGEEEGCGRQIGV